jgi:rhodanese-related sulfurtransferase
MSNGGRPIGSQDADLEQVSVDEAIELSRAGGLLVDVREQDEWDAGHAPDAVHLPLSQLESRFDELPNGEPLLIICHSGYRSLRATDALARAGFSARNVVGGMSAWARAGGPVVTEGVTQGETGGSEPPRT